MKKREIGFMMALVSALVFFAAADGLAQMGCGMMGRGMMGGPGYGEGGYCPNCGQYMGPGGYGMGPGMMGGGMMGRGMMGGPGTMMGPGQGYGYGPGYGREQKPLEEKDAKSILENYIASTRNPNLKVGKIKDAGNVFEAEIVTKKEDAVVDRMLVDKNSGWIRSVY